METSAQPTTPRLIVTIDESTESERVLTVAVALAERLGASIALVGLVLGPGDASRARDRLSNLSRRCGGPVESTMIVDDGDAVAQIRHRVGIDATTLVMVSDRGTSRFDPKYDESLASRLLADGVPIVIVGEHTMGHPADLPVVVCLDDSDESHQAIPAAAAWAAALRVSLVLERVAPPELSPPRVPPALAETRTTDARRALADMAAQTAAAWPDLDVRARMVEYRWGVADAVELSLARHPAQLVVVATHVRSGWKRVAHASVTSPLVHQLTSPLLLVPIEADEPTVAVERGPTVEAVEPARPGTALFDTIIVPIDPAHPTPVPAVRAAATLARLAAASITVLSCSDEPPRDIGRQQREVADLVGSVPVAWRVLRSHVVADEIIAQACHDPSSVICMATDAPDTVVDTLMPTVTGTTLRWSPTVVVLVGPKCPSTSLELDHIAACVDGSPVADTVVDIAATWAAALALPMYLVEVVDPSTTVADAPSLADRYLARLDQRATHDGTSPANVRLDHADAGRALRRWAEQHPGTLMVMGSHGGGRSAHPLGRTVRDVVRHAATPVAVVPRRSAAGG